MLATLTAHAHALFAPNDVPLLALEELRLPCGCTVERTGTKTTALRLTRPCPSIRPTVDGVARDDLRHAWTRGVSPALYRALDDITTHVKVNTPRSREAWRYWHGYETGRGRTAGMVRRYWEA